jgi:NAD(P)-dependent dehydrogenase (short-subunit alcohol dehydrogenase family)
MTDLTGKVAIITGASRGICEAIARGLSAAGAFVVVASRRMENAGRVAEEIRAMGGRALAVEAHAG